MFGFPCAFYNNQMFAGLFEEQMFVRLPADQRAELLAVPGAAPFEPMAGRPMREYVVLPESVLTSSGELSDWLDRALAYVAAMPPKPAKEKKPPKAKSTRAAKPK
jgi:TfoX/Sxy family transcriptional regulator of competence genes